MTLGCPAMLSCALACVDFSMMPPMVQVTCVADCVSRGCPSAQFFFNQTFNCFIQNFGTCGSHFNCLAMQCQTELAACIGKTRCP